MKHFYFALTVLLACVLTSCNGFKSEIQPLIGNEQLNTFTALADDGETILTGVANPQSAFVIVPPADYTSVSGDNHVIICENKAEKYHVFKLNGDKIGVFDLFTHWTDGADYYLGSKYDLQVYYFPKYDVALTARDFLCEYDNLFLFVNGNWQILDNFGKHLWDIPSAFTLIKDSDSPDKLVIAISEKRSTLLYDVNGNKLKTLSSSRWKKLQNKLQNLQQYLGGASVAEVENLQNYL